MKYSKYNIFVPQQKYAVCYNSLSDTMIAISPQAYKIYEQNTPDKLKTEMPTLFNSFFDNGFIIPKERDELALIKLEHKEATFMDRNYQLTLLPSLDCNLKCWYCFEDHIPDANMNKEVQKAVINHVKSLYENKEIDSLVLDWFGGEPLIDFENIAYPIAKEIKKIVEDNNQKFSTFFTTNASLINDKILAKLKEINSSFQITLDGDEERHNKIRHTKKDNQGTYGQIIKTFYKITENIENTFINIRINYDNQTLKNIDNIIDDLIDLDRNKVRIHLERVWQTQVDNEKHNELLTRTIALLTVNDFSVSYINFNRRSFACQAERLKRVAITYDGKVYRCIGRDFASMEPEGQLNPDGTIEWNRDAVAKRLSLTTFEIPMCIDCKLLPVCMGPCSQKTLESTDKDISRFCTLNGLEMTLEDYVLFKYNNSYKMEQIRAKAQEEAELVAE